MFLLFLQNFWSQNFSTNKLLNTKLNFMLRLLSSTSQVTIYLGCQFYILKIYDCFLSIFSSPESFCFKLPSHPRYVKMQKKNCQNCYFLQCNGMQGMLKLENNVATMKQLIVHLNKVIKQFFNSNTLIEFTKVFCTYMRNKELHLLSSRRKFFHLYFRLLQNCKYAICFLMAAVNFIKFTRYFFFYFFHKLDCNTNIMQRKLLNGFNCVAFRKLSNFFLILNAFNFLNVAQLRQFSDFFFIVKYAIIRRKSNIFSNFYYEQ